MCATRRSARLYIPAGFCPIQRCSQVRQELGRWKKRKTERLTTVEQSHDITSGRNRFCRRFRVFCLLSVKVCSWYKTHSKTGNLAGVRYVSILSVPGIQFRSVTVSFEVFSGHKTMMYTLKVLNNSIRDRGSDCNCIINGRLELLVENILLGRCLLSKILFFKFIPVVTVTNVSNNN